MKKFIILNNMRKIKINDKKILSVLNKKKELTVENTNLLKTIEESEKKFNQNLTKTQMIDEKARPMIKKIVDKIELGEYEEVSRVHQEDNGEWNIEIADRMEEFIAAFKSRKK